MLWKSRVSDDYNGFSGSLPTLCILLSAPGCPIWLCAFSFRMCLVKGESGRRSKEGRRGGSCLELIRTYSLLFSKHLLGMALLPGFITFPHLVSLGP